MEFTEFYYLFGICGAYIVALIAFNYLCGKKKDKKA